MGYVTGLWRKINELTAELDAAKLEIQTLKAEMKPDKGKITRYESQNNGSSAISLYNDELQEKLPALQEQRKWEEAHTDGDAGDGTDSEAGDAENKDDDSPATEKPKGRSHNNKASRTERFVADCSACPGLPGPGEKGV